MPNRTKKSNIFLMSFGGVYLGLLRNVSIKTDFFIQYCPKKFNFKKNKLSP